MRQRARKKRDRGEFEEPDYLSWLRKQPGRSPDGLTLAPSVAHHARHDEHGNSVGATIKDDRRAISLSVVNHGHIHALTGPFRGWKKADVHAWVDQQISQQRSEYFLSIPARKSTPAAQIPL